MKLRSLPFQVECSLRAARLVVPLKTPLIAPSHVAQAPFIRRERKIAKSDY